MNSPNQTCEHYSRNCSLFCPSCDMCYACRFCHDDNEDHTLNRQCVKKIKCTACDQEQLVSNECINEKCKTIFGEAYFCKECVLFDNEDKKQFHCIGCGLCRIGGKENFFHCDRCEMCLPISTEATHKCVNEISRRNCAVCLEDIHTSRIVAHVPQCSHLIHKPCFEDLFKAGIYSCPTCGTSLTDMKEVWKRLEEEIEITPIPVEYRNMSCEVICKDCHKVTNTNFHFVGLKCMACGSFNTSQSKSPVSSGSR